MTDTIDLDLQVHEFARAVRLHLADLSPDEVDELTEGLEADLIEQARETGSFSEGDPAAYASELRVAAGIPVRAESRPGFITAVSLEFAHLNERVRAFLKPPPALNSLFAFIGSIRAVWWIARAWLGFLVVNALTNGGGSFWIASGNFPAGSLFIFALLLVVSIQWGRGKWMPRQWLRVVRTLANILAILMIPLGLTVMGTQLNSYRYSHTSTPASYPMGLSRNGVEITNIFAYDANGDPISGVQLYDQDGKALSLRQDSSSDYLYDNGGNYFMVPSDSAAGSSGWNIFPLSRVPQSALTDENQLKTGITPTKVLFPFVKVRPLTSTVSTPTPSPTPAP